MTIEFIYTFDEGEQKIEMHPFVLQIMESKESLFEFATSILNDTEKANLVKISCCVYFAKDVTLPEWYHERNGKYYLAEIIELLKSVWSIKTKIDADTIKMLS